jgi:hypothetical protein
MSATIISPARKPRKPNRTAIVRPCDDGGPFYDVHIFDFEGRGFKPASEPWYRDVVVAAEKLAEVVEIWEARL